MKRGNRAEVSMGLEIARLRENETVEKASRGRGTALIIAMRSIDRRRYSRLDTNRD